MADSPILEPEDRLQEAVLTYLQSKDHGEPLDSRTLLERYADISTELLKFLDDESRLTPLLSPLKSTHPEVEALASPRPFGRYELLEELGRGGMGIVYKARQQGVDRLVALKIMREGSLASVADLERFRNETQTIAALEHPHIVPVYDVGQHDGQLYYTMPLLEGGSLVRHLPQFHDDLRQAAGLVATIARAVHHAHQRGVLHRDIKPSNILLDDAGRPFIADFGLAKRLDADTSLTETGAVLGTPGYMSPEQALGRSREITTSSDIYGLGAILYTLLTGRPPFRGATLLDTLNDVRQREPASISDQNPQVDRDLSAICLKCLEKSPNVRYISAESLADDLDRWLAGVPIQARSVGRLGRAWRWSRRNPAVAALSALAGALLLTIVIALATGVILLDQKRAEALRLQRRAEQGESLALTRATELREHLYAVHMKQAWEAWGKSDLVQLRHLLQLELPAADEDDLRGFEWYLLHNYLTPRTELATIDAHKQAIFGLSFMPDGKRLNTASGDPAGAMWDVPSRKKLFDLQGPNDDVVAAAIHPQGNMALATSLHGTIWTWDLANGQRRERKARLPSSVSRMAISPDGTRLVVAIGGSLRIYALDELDRPDLGEPVALEDAHKADINVLSFSPDGKLLLSASQDGTTTIWNGDNGERLHELNHGGEVISAVFAHRQPILATGDRNGELVIWDAATGKETARVNAKEGEVRAVAMAPDDTLLATSHGTGDIRLWESSTGKLRHSYVGHGKTAWTVAFSPDGNTLASGDHDGAVKFWSVTLPQDRRILQIDPQRLLDCAWSAKGDRVAVVGGGGSIRIYDARTSALQNTLPQDGLASSRVGFDPSGTRVVAGYSDGGVRVWDLERAQIVSTFMAYQQWMRSVAFSPDGMRVLTMEFRDGLFEWDAVTGEKLRALDLHRIPIQGFATARDGTTFATRHNDGKIGLWSYGSAQPRHVIETANLSGDFIALTADGSLLAVPTLRETVELWDQQGTSPRKVLATGRVGSLDFSPDGRTLACAMPDNGVKLWHVASGQELMSLLPGHTVHCVRFSPDGQTLLVSGGELLQTLDAPRKAEPDDRSP